MAQRTLDQFKVLLLSKRSPIAYRKTPFVKRSCYKCFACSAVMSTPMAVMEHVYKDSHNQRMREITPERLQAALANKRAVMTSKTRYYFFLSASRRLLVSDNQSGAVDVPGPPFNHRLKM
jgi:hypothetical protein